MLGLDGYASSDEEGEEEIPIKELDAQVKVDQPNTTKLGESHKDEGGAPIAAAPPADAPTLGPVPGPSMPIGGVDDQVHETEAYKELSYEETREAIRNLTMPPVPNFNIPPSPPGSPNPNTSKKISNFLKLKKQGVHFNARLASTPALRNPTLFQELMKHAGISEEEQYATTLPEDLAVPTSFPPWAYADELNKSQAEIRQRREEQKSRSGRDAIDFVPASASATSSRGSTPHGGNKSAAERVLGGFDLTSQKRKL